MIFDAFEGVECYPALIPLYPDDAHPRCWFCKKETDISRVWHGISWHDHRVVIAVHPECLRDHMLHIGEE